MGTVAPLPPSQLSELHVSALQEMGNIGMGHAATALSQLIKRRVELRVPTVTVVNLADVPTLLGGPDLVVVGVYMRIWGEARGNVLLVFPVESADTLLSTLLGKNALGSSALTPETESVLQEVGNILASSFLSAMGTLLKITLIPSVPAVARDMGGAIVDQVLSELGETGDTCVVVETEFLGEPKIRGHFFLLPDSASLEVLLKAGGVI